MDVTEAIDRIEEIHAQLAKGEIFRGYRPVPVALAGAVGLLAGWAQPRLVPPTDDLGFLAYWLAVAGFNAALNAAVIVTAYQREANAFARRHTRQVVGQFLPCLAAGAAVSVTLPVADPHLVRILPGIWALLFGLGLFASRPYLPRATGWVALFYLLAGSALLSLPFEGLTGLGWANGAVFGAGHLATAAVLYADLPRDACE